MHSGRAAQLGAEGGRVRRIRFDPETLAAVDPPKDAASLVSLLETIVWEVRTGKLEPRTASAIGFIAGVIFKGREVALVEERLERLEARFAMGKPVPERRVV